jgi:hypothetical protein
MEIFRHIAKNNSRINCYSPLVIKLEIPSEFYDPILANKCTVLIEIVYDSGASDVLKFDTRLLIYNAGTMMDFIDQRTRSIPKPEW